MVENVELNRYMATTRQNKKNYLQQTKHFCSASLRQVCQYHDLFLHATN